MTSYRTLTNPPADLPLNPEDSTKSQESDDQEIVRRNREEAAQYGPPRRKASVVPSNPQDRVRRILRRAARPEEEEALAGETPQATDPEPHEPEVTEGPVDEPNPVTHLRRFHERLIDKSELLKLHLKHYHMNPDNFRKRTSALQIPHSVYKLYEHVCKNCEACQRNHKAPERSRITGMRANAFGDLWFVDHVDITIQQEPQGPKRIYPALIVLDACSNLLWAGSQSSKSADETLRNMIQCADEGMVKPKAICGDSALMKKGIYRMVSTVGYKDLTCGTSYTVAE